MSYPTLAPPTRILMGPGPSDIHPRVLAALSAPTVGHLDPYYLQLMNGMQAMLREVFRTKNEMTLAISGTGSAGMEAAVVNLVEPGDSVLVCVNGVFGQRMTDVAERAGARVTKIERPWGEVFTPEEVKRAMADCKPKVVGIVMAETSTGASQPIEEISKIVHDSGALLLVDAVTALGGMPVEVDRWNIDCCYSGSQKCLSCPPGLAPITFSAAAMQRIAARKTKVQSWYLDVTMLAQILGSGSRVSPHRADQHDLWTVCRAASNPRRRSRQLLCSPRSTTFGAEAGLAAIGIRYAAQEGHQLPMLNAVQIPPWRSTT